MEHPTGKFAGNLNIINKVIGGHNWLFCINLLYYFNVSRRFSNRIYSLFTMIGHYASSH